MGNYNFSKKIYFNLKYFINRVDDSLQPEVIRTQKERFVTQQFFFTHVKILYVFQGKNDLFSLIKLNI